MTCPFVSLTATLLQPNAERLNAAGRPEGEHGDQQHDQLPRPTRAAERSRPMTMTTILATIGGITVILTAAARIPAALAEFLRGCVLVVAALRQLGAAWNDRPHDDDEVDDDVRGGEDSAPPSSRA